MELQNWNNVCTINYNKKNGGINKSWLVMNLEIARDVEILSVCGSNIKLIFDEASAYVNVYEINL